MAPALALALALAALGPPGQRLTAAPPSSPRVLGEEITPALRLAVARGYEYFVRKQLPSGEFDHQYPVAVTGLVGLAFLAGGHTPRAGDEHAELLRKAIGALLGRQQVSGYFEDGGSHMYGHGFATLFLAEVYGTSTYRSDDVHQALHKAVKLIEASQSKEGGWDYVPFGSIEGFRGEMIRGSDTSITVCQAMALRASRNLGIVVDKGVVDRATRYVLRMQNPDGGFRYRTSGGGLQGRGSAFPRSAAGVCILNSLGDYNSKEVKRGFEYLEESYRFPLTNEFPFYAHYYCTQALFQAGGRRWRDYFSWISEKLITNQRRDGSWPAHGLETEEQSTAMGLIILQVPYRLLPIFER